MTDIKRYKPTVLLVEGMHEYEHGEYVKYEDHLVIVEKLKAEAYSEGYEEGYDIVTNVGYCQGLMGED